MTDLEGNTSQPRAAKSSLKPGPRQDQRTRTSSTSVTTSSFPVDRPHSGRQGHPRPTIWESTAERGFQLVYGSTANLFIDRHKRVYRLRPGGVRAGRHSRARRPSCSCPGTSASRASSARCFRNREERQDPGALPDLRLPRQPAHASTTSSKKHKACTCATAPSRR